MFGSSTRSRAFAVSRKTTWWRVSLLAHLEPEYECLPIPLKHVHVASAKYFLKSAISGRIGLLIRPEFFVEFCQKPFLLEVVAEIARLGVVVSRSVAVEFVSC